MLMQLAVGLTTGVMAVGLVYGMKIFSKIINYKREGHMWGETFSVQVTKWYQWVSLLFFLLFITMIVIGMGAGIFLG